MTYYHFRCQTCGRIGDGEGFTLDGASFCPGCGTLHPRLEGTTKQARAMLGRVQIEQARTVLSQCANYIDGTGCAPSLAAAARRAASELPSEDANTPAPQGRRSE